MEQQHNDNIVITLNMEHSFTREMVAFLKTAPRDQRDAFFARMIRRLEFDTAMESIGGLTKYRRKLVARALVKMFRAGYRSGSNAGFDRGFEEAEAKNGR